MFFELRSVVCAADMDNQPDHKALSQHNICQLLAKCHLYYFEPQIRSKNGQQNLVPVLLRVQPANLELSCREA